MVAREQVTLLQHLMQERRLTREQTLDLLYQRAKQMGVRDFALSLRQLDRWLAGHVGTAPRPSTCRVVEAEFNHPIDTLLAKRDEGGDPHDDDVRSSESPSLRDLVAAAAWGSSRFALWADSVRIGDLSIIALRARTTALAVDYVTKPLVPVFRELVGLRDDLFKAITRRPDPVRLREAYFLAGTTCAMLAYACGDLGFPQAATAQTQAALACAEKAGNPALIAWLLGNRALTTEWYGQPMAALDLAAEARAHAQRARPPGTILVRLASIEARAYARLGRTAQAKDAINSAVAARELTEARHADQRNEFDEIGGILTFTAAKQHFYSGSVFLRSGDPAAAQRAALAAIDAYASGPPDQRSYGDEALAWIDVASSRVADPEDDLDGAAQALDVVLALPPSRQIPALAQPLTDLRNMLTGSRYESTALADRMRESIDDFIIASRRRTQSEITA